MGSSTAPPTAAGLRIEAVGVGQRVGGGRRGRGGRLVLADVSLAVEPGTLVAVIGASGTGKTTLLDALAGVRPPARGAVRYGGAATGPVGYVPQDDIIHRELPLGRILRYAGRLRLPAGTPAGAVDAAVAGVLDTLGLTDRAGVPVGQLSGGERKRASIAVELLTRPRAFFLDEPTSGLDPVTAADVVGQLRRIAAAGTTVVFTTHSPADVPRCDQVVVLAPGGRLAFAGTPADATAFFDATGVAEIYQRLAADGAAAQWARRFAAGRPTAAPADPDPGPRAGSGPSGRPVGAARQWAVLTRRNLDILASNRVTLAILAGCPLMVLLMMIVLFRPHAFAPADPSPSATAMILFWVAFGAFFFGLTYGLLQICTELAVLRRERFVVLRLGPYLLAKLAVLLPLLALVDAAMLGALRATDRLPAAGGRVYGSLFGTLLLSSAAALALGLLASAAVSEPAQATMALPMLCFPQVLFSGAILPVPLMAAAGRLLSYPMSNRWTFEGLGHGLGVARLWARGGSPLGPPLLASYGNTFGRPVAVDWAVLAGFTAVLLGWAWLLVHRRTGSAGWPAQQRSRGVSPVGSG